MNAYSPPKLRIGDNFPDISGVQPRVGLPDEEEALGVAGVRGAVAVVAAATAVVPGGHKKGGMDLKSTVIG